MKKILLVGCLLLSVNAQAKLAELTEEQCTNLRAEYRIEPFSNAALERAIGLQADTRIGKCVYPELVIEPINIGELENYDQWENGTVGVTLSARTKYTLGNFSAVVAYLNSTKGYTVKAEKIGDETIDQYQVIAFKK